MDTESVFGLLLQAWEFKKLCCRIRHFRQKNSKIFQGKGTAEIWLTEKKAATLCWSWQLQYENCWEFLAYLRTFCSSAGVNSAIIIMPNLIHIINIVAFACDVLLSPTGLSLTALAANVAYLRGLPARVWIFNLHAAIYAMLEAVKINIGKVYFWLQKPTLYRSISS